MKTRSLVIGMGEVGKAVFNVLRDAGYEVESLDQGGEAEGKFVVINVCFPYSDHFFSDVAAYKMRYLDAGGIVIIHSTVPIGTTEDIKDAVHSPVRGVHPNLELGLKTFTKYFGGEKADTAAAYFASVNADTVAVPNPRDTEALKLWDTTYYGWAIIFEKGVRRFCEKNGLDFNLIYTHANKSYNEGYTKLGMSHVVRPVLKHVDGKIGGHCVIPNCKLLDHDIPKTILDINEAL